MQVGLSSETRRAMPNPNKWLINLIDWLIDWLIQVTNFFVTTMQPGFLMSCGACINCVYCIYRLEILYRASSAAQPTRSAGSACFQTAADSYRAAYIDELCVQSSRRSSYSTCRRQSSHDGRWRSSYWTMIVTRMMNASVRYTVLSTSSLPCRLASMSVSGRASRLTRNRQRYAAADKIR